MVPVVTVQVEERRGQQEFLYFSAVELLTFGTFAGDAWRCWRAGTCTCAETHPGWT